MNSTSPKSAMALPVVSECNVYWSGSVCRSSMWCGSSDAQWISRSWSFQKQQVLTQHKTIHVSVGLHVDVCESQCRRDLGKLAPGCLKADSFHSFYSEKSFRGCLGGVCRVLLLLNWLLQFLRFSFTRLG